jgi:LCP family protein required for cell wall assembly
MKKRFGAVLLALLLLLSQTSCTEVRAAGTEEGLHRITRILLLGLDRAASLADTVMLVTVDETAGEARILQIPRDTYAEYTQKTYKKLNGAPAALGTEGFLQFLSHTLGVRIDRFVTLRPQALRRIVDAIGGVDVCIPQPMYYSDPAQGLEIALEAGERRLTGAEAEQFVRFRAGYANADLGRLDAQKLFLCAFAKRCKSLTVGEMLRAALGALTTVETNLGVHEVVRLCGTLRACDPDATPMKTLSGEAVQGGSGAWYYAVNRAEAIRDVRAYLLPTHYKDADFDPDRVLDREDEPSFHRIYEADAEVSDPNG